MIPYIIFYIVVFLLSFKIKKNKFSIFDVLMLLILILFSALRYGIGTDYHMYHGIYKNFNTIEESATSRTGIAYSYLMYFFKNILMLDYQYIIAFTAIVTIICFYYFFKKNSEHPGKSILFYVSIGLYVSAFNGFRQNMSIALALVGLTLYKNNKKAIALPLVITAALLHSSTLFLILSYYIFCIKKVSIKPQITFIISVLLFFSYDMIFPIIIGLFNSYSGYIETSFSTTPGIGTYMMVLVYYFLYYIMFQHYKSDFSEKEKSYLNIFSVAICSMSLQLHNWMFSRILDIFIAFVPILLSSVYFNILKNKNGRTYSLLFHASAFAYYLVYVYSFGEVVPYTNIMFKGV